MTVYEPNPDVRPTGAEAGEFAEQPEPHPAAPPERVRTHPDDRDPADADRAATERAEREAEMRGQQREDDEG